MSLIMMIPPLGTASALRTSLLLRLTGEVLDGIPGYTLEANTSKLLEYLDDLDKAWVAVLESQIWDSESASGSDLILPANHDMSLLPSQVSQTERTRLKSLLVLGTEKLEDWLPRIEDVTESDADGMDNSNNRFNDIFFRTLTSLGELS